MLQRLVLWLLVSGSVGSCDVTAGIYTFGSGGNQFSMEFVPVGNPGNADDTTGSPDPAGRVDYAFQMGKFEVSEEMISKANTAAGMGITIVSRGANKPATSVSWFEAARFVNWLNADHGFSPAYKFNGPNFELWTAGDAGFDAANPFRNRLARFVLPSMDEWYKAAYYDPGSGSYFDFPTGSDTAPIPVASGTSAGTAVYEQPVFVSGPADITQAGGLSPYGTMGQGGNVWEWEESRVNNSNSAGRSFRGGSWVFFPEDLSVVSRLLASPSDEVNDLGFRVARVPEAGSAVYVGIAMLALLLTTELHQSGLSLLNGRLGTNKDSQRPTS